MLNLNNMLNTSILSINNFAISALSSSFSIKNFFKKQHRFNKFPVGNTSKSNFGFTLAEVLITLAIIGVIAALTIPTLLQQQQNQRTVSALKKAYSEIAQAYSLAIQENGTPDNWGLSVGIDQKLLNTIVPYLKITKNCIGVANCAPNIDVRDLSNKQEGNYLNFYNYYPSVMLSDGTVLIGEWVQSTNCSGVKGTSSTLQHVCADMAIDINGFQKPNQSGIDLFWFWLTKDGIVPMGSQSENTVTFDSYCKDKSSTLDENGIGCSAWVLYNENMDYLNCATLGWDTNKKCS